MQALRVLITSSLLGCSGSMVGDWNGQCLFDSPNESIDDCVMDVSAEIWRDTGYVVEGKMTLLDWNETQHTGTLNGDHSGKYVLLKTDIDTDIGPYLFRIEAERFGQVIEGNCVIRAPDSVGALVGYGSISR